MPPDPDSTVPVPLGPRSYDIRVTSAGPDRFGAFAREALDRSWAGRACRRGLIVADANVAGLVAPFADSLRESGIATTIAEIPPGEGSKSLARAEDLYERLVEMRADRHVAVIAFGGGVVGDLAGFAAATYARGLPLLMVPTSLLAQVDSSVGGKVGVNLPGAKNIVGAFHQPSGVWIDTQTLLTLPLRELRCGLAEVVKYGVIMDPDFFGYLERHADAILAGAPGAIREIVTRCCTLKAKVVAEDEREETGVRVILNFGHTVGHAIEAVAGYGGGYQHGEAVAAGMVAESRLAEGIGWTGPETTDRIRALLAKFGLPIAAPGLDRDALREAMARDKKNQDGVRFVLPRAIGRVDLTRVTDGAAVEAALAGLEGA